MLFIMMNVVRNIFLVLVKILRFFFGRFFLNYWWLYIVVVVVVNFCFFRWISVLFFFLKQNLQIIDGWCVAVVPFWMRCIRSLYIWDSRFESDFLFALKRRFFFSIQIACIFNTEQKTNRKMITFIVLFGECHVFLRAMWCSFCFSSFVVVVVVGRMRHRDLCAAVKNRFCFVNNFCSITFLKPNTHTHTQTQSNRLAKTMTTSTLNFLVKIFKHTFNWSHKQLIHSLRAL